MEAAPLIPDHELIRVIGRGSYGEVWLAKNVMGVLRAVKIVISRGGSSPSIVERELAGIQRYEPVSRSHEGLVQVLHIGRLKDPDGFFYVMELADDASTTARADGFPEDLAEYEPKTLRSLTGEGKAASVEECVDIGMALAAGLAQLHKCGLVHRDLKPANIIFVRGRPKLADIGLVSEVGATGSVVGTEGYIAPEGPGSTGADIFSLGKILYELATGLDRLQYPEIPGRWLEASGQSREMELNEVLIKSCEGNAAARYGTAEELQADLALLQVGRSLRRMHKMERRLRLATRTGMAALLLAAGGAGYSAWSHHQASTERHRREELETARRESEQRLWQALLEKARAGRYSGMSGARFETLTTLSRAAGLRKHAALRDEAAAALALPDLRIRDVWPAAELRLGERIVPWCAGPRHVLVQAGVGISLFDSYSATPVRKLTHSPTFTGAATTFSPDGRKLAVGLPDGSLTCWNLETGTAGQAARLPVPQWNDLESFVFHPNGEVIAAVSTAAQQVWLFSVETGQILWTTPLPGTGLNLAFDPDGRRVAVICNGSGTVFVMDAATGRVTNNWECGKQLLALAWSADSRRLAISDEHHDIQVRHGGSGQLLATARGHDGPVNALAFHPNDSILASMSWDGTTRIWDAVSGHSLARLATAGVRCAFNASGDSLLINSWNEAQLVRCDFTARRAVRSLVLPPDWPSGAFDSAVLLPGNAVAAGGDAGLFLWPHWDSASPRQLKLTPCGTVLNDDRTEGDAASFLASGGSGCKRWNASGAGDPAIVLATDAGKLMDCQNGWMVAADGAKAAVQAPDGTLRDYQASESIHTVAISSDGRWIAAGPHPRPGVFVWEQASGAPLLTIPTASSAQVRFAPNSAILVVSDSSAVSAIELPAGKKRFSLPRQSTSGIWGPIAFSRDGKRFAYAETRFHVRLTPWHAESEWLLDESEMLSLECPLTPMLHHASFSMDGRHLLLAGRNNRLLLWDLAWLDQQLQDVGL